VSDKETAPWIKERAGFTRQKIYKFWQTARADFGQAHWQALVQEAIEEAFAEECTAQAPTQLAEALKTYGANHIWDCDALNKWKKLPCDCGFAALLRPQGPG
jgi:hypothetical protein